MRAPQAGFLNKLHSSPLPRNPTGFESHDVHVNPDKTKLSFALQLPPAAGAGAAGSLHAAAAAPGVVMPAAVWRSGDGSTFVKWCGLLLNTATLEVQGDYTRWVGA